MSRWLSQALERIHSLSWRRRIWFTHKALGELAQLGLDEMDARMILMELSPADSHGRVRSRATGEWLYVFRTRVAGVDAYVKLVLRRECVVVSFHEERGEDGE